MTSTEQQDPLQTYQETAKGVVYDSFGPHSCGSEDCEANRITRLGLEALTTAAERLVMQELEKVRSLAGNETPIEDAAHMVYCLDDLIASYKLPKEKFDREAFLKAAEEARETFRQGELS